MNLNKSISSLETVLKDILQKLEDLETRLSIIEARIQKKKEAKTVND